MYITYKKKALNMLILQILQEYSDYEHRLTQQDIIRILKRDHEVECDRRSVKSNILNLIDKGIQTFITTTEVDNLDEEVLKKSRLFKVLDGEVRED